VLRTWISLAVIAFAVTAILAGYASGIASLAAQTPVVAPSIPPPLSEGPIRGVRVAQSDELAADVFANDPVVAGAASATNRAGDDARLAFVIVGCGRSLALETGFVTLAAPLTLVIDPDAPLARDVARVAAANGKTVYIQLDAPPSAAQLRRLRSVFPSMRGVAARIDPSGSFEPVMFARALRGSGLRFFEEYGNGAARAAFAREGIGYASRLETVDDHLEPGYVRFMLAQTVALARGAGAVAVLARPHPATLDALRTLLNRSRYDGIVFVGLGATIEGKRLPALF
jgi:polysaccharide deacetylase 2 family uncharacterized protein YibQ